jgi:hypothetical protein
MKDTRELYGLDIDSSKSPLLSLGITLVVIPDPITTAIGAGVIAFGLVQQRIVGSPLYIKDIYENLTINMDKISLDNNSITSEITIDFPKIIEFKD